MSWRVAKSILVLRDQIDAASPNRDKSSDGGIGNEEHAGRGKGSDHNPWVIDPATGIGVVRAYDFTNDPAHGVVSDVIAHDLVASKDNRIYYVISNGKIANPSIQDGAWRPYGGTNPHNHHFHISVKENKANYDDTVPWQLALTANATPPAPAPRPVLRKGSSGADVVYLQQRLNLYGAALHMDGDFGNLTSLAVKKFQGLHDLVPDGIVGGYSWRVLNKE
ncbi:MAG: peptidoglycan-binding domain-containing protein, partial [Sulfuricaulis sp.]|nr:peptidoglycan-binding domain-containing protein [Sulfuricaulis sp.]